MGWALARLAICAVLTVAGGSAGAAGYKAPHTNFGQPDLQGTWSNASLTQFERPARFKALVIPAEDARRIETSPPPPPGPPPPGSPDDALFAGEAAVGTFTSEWPELHRQFFWIDGQARSSWITDPADGRKPYTPEGRRTAQAAWSQAHHTFDNPEDRPVDERCLLGTGATAGPPLLGFNYNSNVQIVQSKDHVAILVEMNHDVRIIRLKDKAHAPSQIRPWMGDSIGWWDGDTLVVESTNFNPRESLRPAIAHLLYLSPRAKVTERFTRIAADAILYRFAIEDPAIYAQAWGGEALLRSTPGPIYEFACHEGNYALADILSGARAGEATPPAPP
jgi:hypothetical protein